VMIKERTLTMEAQCRFWVLVLVGIIGALVPSVRAGEDELLALKASKVLNGMGKSFEPGVVVIKGSQIVSVGESVALPENCRVLDFDDQVICPGFIDMNTTLGAEKDLHEPASAFQTDVRAIDLFSPGHEDFEAALKNGITTAVIAPLPRNVFSGRAALLKTWGQNRKERTLCSNGPLVMTVAPTCFKEDRMPTSRMGAVELMRNAFEDTLKMQNRFQKQERESTGSRAPCLDGGTDERPFHC